MSPLATLKVAGRALVKNKLRSFLTVLGVVIGVAAVIAMVAIGEGAKQRVRDTFASMGTNLLVVQSGSGRQGGVRGGAGATPSLTWADLRAIQTEVPSVKWAAPQLSARMQLIGEDQNWNTQVIGTTPAYFDIRSWSMARGSIFTDGDAETGTKVAILGKTVADNLFGPGADPVGQSVRVKNVPFTVIGVAAAKGQSPMGQDYDDAVWIPVKSFQTRVQGGLGNYIAGQIYVSAASDVDVPRAERQVAALLRDRHRLRPGEDDDFSIRNLAEVAAAQEESTGTFTTLLAAIAAVSLLVGGIGIMNIMLVSVTERTREIGTRMAVGAKGRHILLQFLVESMSLALIGGLIGVALGVGAALQLGAQFGWPTAIRPDIVVIAVAFSAAVGIGFGLYPARKASRLDPIQALRYE
jgi:putative ABC transport system permease protein